jgi:glycosyltransferase involved in cell wall biosynthesis
LIYHLIDIIDSKYGGAQRMIEDFIAIEGSSNNESKHVFVQILGVPQNEVRTLSTSDSLYSINTFVCIFKFFRSLKDSDILHVHLFPALYFAALAKKTGVLKSKLLFTEHNSYNKRRKLGWMGKQMESWIYKEFETIVCISNSVQQSLTNWLPALSSRYVLVYNGIDLSNFDPIGLKANTKQIISVGRLTEQKNYIKTLHLLKPVLKQSDWKYAIAGEGQAREEIENTVLELNLTNAVDLKGRIADIREFYQNANILVLLSKWEGFGLTVVEALAMGLRVIAYRLEGLQEILEPIENKGVLLIDSEHDDSMVTRLMELFIESDDTEIHREIRMNRAREFDIRNTWREYNLIYQNLI